MQIKLPTLLTYISAILFLYFISQTSVEAQGTVKINKLSSKVILDGRPNEAAWEQASLFPMIVHSPNFGNEPTEASEVMVAYDQEFLWIAARLYSRDPSNITSTSKKRDEESRNSDNFGIVLDTYDDNENALAFFTMPSGARIDYTVSSDGEGGGGGGMGSVNRSWNTFWGIRST